MTSIKEIDALLPQTQCQLCAYPGCLPYADAIIKGEADIDRCVPGGLATLEALGQLMQKDITPLKQKVIAQTKPHQIARIRPELCIGCTKCIPACPVDAIVGSGKLMHIVITEHCTGCELCIAPCPMDCIDLLPAPLKQPMLSAQADASRERYQRHQDRLEKITQKNTHSMPMTTPDVNKTEARQTYIREAMERVQAKRLQRTQETPDE